MPKLKFPNQSNFIVKCFFCVFSIRPSNINIKAGKAKKILIKLNITPLARTIPKSRPIVKLINTKASNPTIVVIELLEIEPKEWYKAFFIASSLFLACSFSWVYLFINIIE